MDSHPASTAVCLSAAISQPISYEKTSRAGDKATIQALHRLGLRPRRPSTAEELHDEEAVFPDFYVICDGCITIQRCVELPHMANGGRLLLCADCVVAFLSGTWFNGVKISDTINVSSELMQLAASAASSGKVSPSPPKLLELASPKAVLQEEDDTLPGTSPHDHQTTTNAKANVNMSPDESDNENEIEKSASSMKFPVSRGAAEATTPVKENNAMDIDEKLEQMSTASAGKSTPVDVPVRPRTDSAHGNEQRASTYSTLPETPADSDQCFSPCGEARAEYSHCLGPGQLTGDEPVGELEMQVRVGAESISGQSGLIIDVLQGHNFKHWGGVTFKPTFQIYVKCYLMSGSKVKAKLKTHSVPPSAQPQFFDQLISVMDKKVLEKLDSVKVQMWENHRSLKKNFAIGTATIALSEIRLEDNVIGKYPIFLPRRSGPTTPHAVPADSPPNALTRSPAGRFDLRSSFRRLGTKRNVRRNSMSEAPNNIDSSIPKKGAH